jgi:hypothetical protein
MLTAQWYMGNVWMNVYFHQQVMHMGLLIIVTQLGDHAGASSLQSAALFSQPLGCGHLPKIVHTNCNRNRLGLSLTPQAADSSLAA